MATPAKPAREAAPQNSWSITGMVGDWIRQGTEGLIATQKILLDLAAQQNALALSIARERLSLIAPFPSKAVVDVTSKTVHNFMEAQQTLLDIAAKENDIVAEGLKPGMENTPIEGLAEVVHQGLANCIDAQKTFLSFVEAETQDAVKEVGDGKGFDTGHLSDVAKEGVRTFVKTQKKFLEIIEEELLTDETKPKRTAKEKKHIDLFDIAKESVDAYVEAQKRLLDLASDQINVNVRFVKDVFQKPDRDKVTALPDIVKKSVDSFVAAQKALVDLASKPRTAAENSHPEILVGRA
jgi:cell fate (sporulation/competence/biofilm development) regulator YlbF (YheA/YmcA/DUF963 family)